MNNAPGGIAQRWRAAWVEQIRDLSAVPRPQLGDVVGGISVALVLIPQSLAYADLAGLPAHFGLIASAFPLLVFAMLASSPYLQTGPVALTSLLTAGALTSTGLEASSADYISAAALLAFLVGAMRLVLGIGRLGSVVYLMAEPVTLGFTAGAGTVILSSQLPKALGVVLPDDVAAWKNPITRAGWALGNVGEWSFEAIVISLVTLTLMLGGRKLHKLFPGVLIAVVLSLIYARATNYSGPAVPSIEGGIPSWSLDLPWDNVGTLFIGALVIALVGFAEPASIARTFASEEQEPWSASRELVSSGFANLVAGLTGGFPVGGSFSRSSVNKFAGAVTRWSGAITGIVVLAFLPFSGLLERLPDAVLGAIVVGAVLNLVNPRRLARLVNRSPYQAGLAWVTFVLTLITPPNVQWAVLIGVVLTLIFHVVRPFHLEDEQSSTGGELRIRARGLLWFLTTRRLVSLVTTRLAESPDTRHLVLNLERCTAIDAGIAEAMAGCQEAAEAAGATFSVIHAPDGAVPILEKIGVDASAGESSARL